MSVDQRLVAVLLTVAVPDAADASDAATLVALAAETTALDVVHTTAVEGHLPLPGSTVLRGRQPRPGLVKAVNGRTAMSPTWPGEWSRCACALWPPTRSPPPLSPGTPQRKPGAGRDLATGAGQGPCSVCS